MKLKSKLMMAVMAVVFLAAGSAWATAYNINYVISGSEGNYTIEFSLFNNLYDEYGLKIYFFGVDQGTAFEKPDEWNVNAPGATWSNANYGGNNLIYTNYWNTLPKYIDSDNASGFSIKLTDLPETINYFLFMGKGTKEYQGTDAFRTGTNPGFEGSITLAQAVPEPFTTILLSFGLFALAALKRKIKQ